MSETQSVVAIVPMRSGSKRVVDKNRRPLGGRPLFHHVIGALGECDLVSTVVVDSNDADLLADVSAAFPEVRLVERPDELARDSVQMNEVLVHTLARVDGDVVLQTHATNPLLRPSTIDMAINAYLARPPGYDSVLSVTPQHKRFWGADGTPLNHDPDDLIRTQDLPPLYEENSCLYIFTRRGFLRSHSRIGERPLLYPVPPEEAWDIDNELDLVIAAALYAQRIEEGGT